MRQGDEPAAVMADLGPRVREENKGAPQGPVGQLRKQNPRVVPKKSYIRDAVRIDGAECPRQAGHIGLRPDETDLGMFLRLLDQVLSAPETNFEPNVFHRAAEHGGKIEHAMVARSGWKVNLEPRKQGFEQMPLSRA